MDKRVVASGFMVLLIAVVIFGVSISPSSVVMAIANQGRTTPIVANMMMGKLDLTVTIVAPSWIVDAVNTNTGASVKNTNVPLGTSISFSGTLTGSDGLAIAGYWVALNLLSQGLNPESGSQCWIGSAQTNAQGKFGSGYYLQPKSDGWWSNYPGVDGAYIQTKNGAENFGCPVWATTNPLGLAYSVYAAVNPTYFSGVVPFRVAANVVSCSITGTVYINDVVVTAGASVRSPPAITFAFVPDSASSSLIQAVTLTGGPSGNALMSATGSKYVISQTWAIGTYVVAMVASCISGGTTPVLRMTATLDSSLTTTTITDTLQQIRGQLAILTVGVGLFGAIIIGYGYKKPN